MNLIRRFVFYSFLLIYIVFCPLTILYALGYSFKPGSARAIVQTGLIYVATAPSGATVSLNETPHKGKSPVVIRDLLPGYYRIRIELKGYRPWVEEIPVEAERASVLEKILLIPENLKSTEFPSQSYDSLGPVYGTSKLILKRGKRVRDFQVFDLKRKSVDELVPKGSIWEEASMEHYDQVAGSVVIMAHVSIKDQSHWIQLDLSGKEGPKDLSALFSETPEKLIWEPGHEEHLMAYQHGFLDYLRADKMLVHPKVAANLRGFGVLNKTLYLLRGDHTVAASSFDGRIEKILLRDSSMGESLFGTAGFYRLGVLSRNLLLFHEEKTGELLTNRLPHLLAQKGVRGYEYFPKNKKLLVWTESKIGILDFDHADQPEDAFFEQGLRLVWVYEGGEDLERAFWIFRGSQVLFQDGERISFLDLEAFSKAKVLEMFKVRSKTQFYYSDETGMAYGLHPKTEKLFAVEIVPRKEIDLIPFVIHQEKIVRRKLMQS